MNRTLLVLGITLAAAMPAKADLTHKIMSSVSLQVGGAVTSADRIGSSFNISGSGVDSTDGTTANTVSAGTITSGVYSPGTIAVTQDTPGEAFSFSQSYTQADVIPTSAVTTGAAANFGSIVSTAHGVAGDLAGTIASDGTMSITAGGANTLAIGQLTTELTIK
jgi:hypothetical protein|tara:strand:- start:796 stop:1287 length:492 start_codon:yes stop_codon:yes gene_type:complete